MKIGQYLAKIWTRVQCLLFLTHGVYGGVAYGMGQGRDIVSCMLFLRKFSDMLKFRGTAA